MCEHCVPLGQHCMVTTGTDCISVIVSHPSAANCERGRKAEIDREGERKREGESWAGKQEGRVQLYDLTLRGNLWKLVQQQPRFGANFAAFSLLIELLRQSKSFCAFQSLENEAEINVILKFSLDALMVGVAL
jgi:hypothetical protein